MKPSAASASGEPPPWRITPDGLVLQLRVTPRGGRDAIDGIVRLGDGSLALGLRVRAAPEAGEANAAVLGLLARELGLPKSAFELLRGATGRGKSVLARGDGAELARRLAAICFPAGPSPKE